MSAETLNGFRPPQKPENLTSSPFYFSEGDGKVTADTVDLLLRYRSKIPNSQSPDRISPIPEPQQPIETPLADHTEDLRGLQRIMRWFQEGGVNLSKKMTNYELPPVRWAALEARSAGILEAFKQHETKQIETALGERYKVSESPIIYQIDQDSRLRNDIYPKEPFAEGMQRGAAYLKEKGSPDTEREQKEIEGFLKIEAKLASPKTPIGTKMIVCSPPSQLEGSIYGNNFVDCFEKTGQKVVTMSRFATDATYGEGFTDAYALSHPDLYEATDSRTGQEIVSEKYGLANGVVSSTEKESILQDSQKRIKFFIETVCDPAATAESIFIAFQAVLNGADTVARGFNRIVQTVFKGVERAFNKLPTFKSIAEEVSYLGRLPVELVAAACGISGGGFLKGIKGIAGSIMKAIRNGFEGLLKFKNGCSACGRMGVELECGVCDNCKTE